MRRPLLAALIFLTLGPVPGTAMRFPVNDDTQEVAARPIAFAPQAPGMLRFVRGWHLVSPHSRFGGLSAVAVMAPGRFQFVGDNGYVTRLTLRPDGSAGAFHIAALPTPDGRLRKKSMIDAEAMAFDPASQRTRVAFEGTNEIWRFDPGLTRIETRYAPAAMRRWSAYAGPEAMVRLADGRTILFCEAPADDSRGSEALVFAGDPAAAGPPPLRFFYHADGKGSVSDAAALPDGRILLVHRRLGFDPVFTTILALVDPADIRADGVVRSRTIGRVPKPLADNFEGAAISTEGGRTWLWLVSDDNFNNWQRSLLLQFELVDLPPRRTPDSKKAAR
jgi:hypothetical protein